MSAELIFVKNSVERGLCSCCSNVSKFPHFLHSPLCTFYWLLKYFIHI